jgi:hypothetical protein
MDRGRWSGSYPDGARLCLAVWPGLKVMSGWRRDAQWENMVPGDPHPKREKKGFQPASKRKMLFVYQYCWRRQNSALPSLNSPAYRFRPMRRSRSWNRGSERRGSKLGRRRTDGLNRSP